MTKKWLATAATAALLVGTLLVGTLAYFQDTADKKNTFTTGMVDIELEEDEFDDLEDEDKVLVPGRVIPKDPTVVVQANSEDAYVRARIDFSTGLEALLEDLTIDPLWVLEADGYYYYANMVAKSGSDTILPAIFTHVQVKTTVTNADLASMNPEIDITAHAIQAEGFTNAQDAFSNFTP